MRKNISQFTTQDHNDSNVYLQRGINELIYQKVLNHIPIPITLWKLMGEDFSLTYSNTYAKEIIGTNLSIGNKLSKVLPNEYKKFFFHQSSNYGNNSTQMMLDKNLLLIFHTELTGNLINQNLKLIDVPDYGQNELIGRNLSNLNAGTKSSEEYKKLWDGVICNFLTIKKEIFNLKETHHDFRKSEKYESLGTMTAYVAHEIKTPLTSIRINIDLLEKQKSIDADSKRLLLIVQMEVNRLLKLLKNILQFSNRSGLSLVAINLHKKIEIIREFVEPLLKEKRITLFNRTLDHNILGDAQQLQSLFIHLIENSIESMDIGGIIEISSVLRGNQCYIYFKDNGSGVDCADNIFEPFVSTKSTGTGLGLPIVKNIIDRHHGSIKLVNSNKGETIFEIILQSR